ncbi:MAG: enoyl-CoA hydratase-related protein [Azospirillaceae bacterium]
MTVLHGEPPLVMERRGHVAVLRINRPDKHNALSPEVICRFDDAIRAFIDDPDLRAAVITGTGERSFCAGGDLALTLPLLSGARVPETAWDRRILADPGIMERSALKGVTVEKPIIAAVNGHCLAGGMELLLGTDIRIASQTATFGLPEPRRGVIPFAGALVRLPRQIAYAHAMELLLTGDAVDAETALRIGLINRVVPPDQVLPAALALAERIAGNAPVAVSEIKKTVTASSGRDLETGFRMEAASMDVVMATEDAREGPRAFIEKRKPRFRGR